MYHSCFILKYLNVVDWLYIGSMYHKLRRIELKRWKLHVMLGSSKSLFAQQHAHNELK